MRLTFLLILSSIKQPATYLVGLSGGLVDGIYPGLNVADIVGAQVVGLAAVPDEPDDVAWLTKLVSERGAEAL